MVIYDIVFFDTQEEAWAFIQGLNYISNKLSPADPIINEEGKWEVHIRNQP